MPEIVKGFVLRKFRGAPVKKITLYVISGIALHCIAEFHFFLMKCHNFIDKSITNLFIGSVSISSLLVSKTMCTRPWQQNLPECFLYPPGTPTSDQRTLSRRKSISPSSSSASSSSSSSATSPGSFSTATSSL